MTHRRRPQGVSKLGAVAISLSVVSLILGACRGGAAVEWGYTGEGGPERWGDLSEAYRACKEGARQSPIDIAGYVDGPGRPLSFAYGSPAVEIENDGRLVQAHYEEGNAIDLGGRTHHLKSLHAHVPSEHTIDGESFALGAAHGARRRRRRVSGRVAALPRGCPDPAVQALIDAAPATGETVDAHGRLDPSLYSPSNLGYYRYTGSKTTPPCNGPVDWLVMAETGTVSVEQARQVSALTGGVPTNRPLQPLGGREIARTMSAEFQR